MLPTKPIPPEVAPVYDELRSEVTHNWGHTHNWGQVANQEYCG